mgnify:FL=1
MRVYSLYSSLNPKKLASDSVRGGTGLPDAGGKPGDDHVNDNGEEGGEERGERVVHTTVLLDADDLMDRPADDIHPREGGGEGEAGHDGVKRLGLELAGNS